MRLVTPSKPVNIPETLEAGVAKTLPSKVAGPAIEKVGEMDSGPVQIAAMLEPIYPPSAPTHWQEIELMQPSFQALFGSLLQPKSSGCLAEPSRI